MPIHGPKAGEAFTAWMPVLAAGTRDWVSSPYFGYGNAYISKNGGAESPATNAPELAADGYWVKLQLTADEMNSPSILIRLHDTGGEWDDTGEVIYTTATGSGSGVVSTILTTAFIDPNELANLVAPIIANLLQTTFNWFTATEVQQMRYALGLSGVTTSTTGSGVTDAIKAKTDLLTFTGSVVQAVVTSFATAAQNDLRTQIYNMFSEAGKTLNQLSGVPPATPTVEEAIMWVFQWLRNGDIQTATSRSVRDSTASTIASQTITDNGSSIVKGVFS